MPMAPACISHYRITMHTAAAQAIVYMSMVQSAGWVHAPLQITLCKTLAMKRKGAGVHSRGGLILQILGYMLGGTTPGPNTPTPPDKFQQLLI